MENLELHVQADSNYTLKIKRCYDQMRFIPEMQGRFKMRKFLIHHLNKSKGKNYKIFSIDAENRLHKI